MRFGVREICDVVFNPLTAVDIGNQHFDAMQPVLYLDTAKTSSLEGAATTVYAQGGKGNPRLIGWDGEKTLTFTVEDALMSAQSFAMLSGAGVVKGVGQRQNLDDMQKIYVHQTFDLVVEGTSGNFYAKLPYDVRNGIQLIATKEAPIYATVLDSAGSQKYFLSAIKADEIYLNIPSSANPKKAGILNRGMIVSKNNDDTDKRSLDATQDLYFKLAYSPADDYTDKKIRQGDTVRIDCYAVYGDGATELQIDAKTFAGYYYIEASTLFRDEETGADLPAEFVIPRGKIQSNFTFTIDAFPAYTKFNKTEKVMATLQILEPEAAHHNYADTTVLGHNDERGDTDSEEYYEEIYNHESIFDPQDEQIQSDLQVVITKGKALTASSTQANKEEFLRLFSQLSDAEERIARNQLSQQSTWETVIKPLLDGPGE